MFVWDGSLLFPISCSGSRRRSIVTGYEIFGIFELVRKAGCLQPEPVLLFCGGCVNVTSRSRSMGMGELHSYEVKSINIKCRYMMRKAIQRSEVVLFCKVLVSSGIE